LALDDVNPTDRAVRMEGSLLPTHKTDAALKSSSTKAFLENGQIPEFRNPVYVFSIRNETMCRGDYICEIMFSVIFWDWPSSSHFVQQRILSEKAP
jgi:hypothetical protein